MNDFKLDDHKIKSGFNTPDNYFDAFPQRIEKRLEEKPVISLFAKRLKIFYAVAALLVLALMIPLFTTDKTEELDAATLESYLAHHTDLSQFDMLTLLEKEDIATMEVDFPVEEEAIEDVLATNSNVELLLIEL